MKKFIKTLGAVICSLPVAALAIPGPTQPNQVPSNLPTAITTVSNTILMIIGVIAVLFLIIGGFQYVTSAGSPDSIGKAKSTILYGILGLIFAILAYAIVSFITTNLA